MISWAFYMFCSCDLDSGLWVLFNTRLGQSHCEDLHQNTLHLGTFSFAWIELVDQGLRSLCTLWCLPSFLGVLPEMLTGTSSASGKHVFSWLWVKKGRAWKHQFGNFERSSKQQLWSSNVQIRGETNSFTPRQMKQRSSTSCGFHEEVASHMDHHGSSHPIKQEVTGDPQTSPGSSVLEVLSSIFKCTDTVSSTASLSFDVPRN